VNGRGLGIARPLVWGGCSVWRRRVLRAPRTLAMLPLLPRRRALLPLSSPTILEGFPAVRVCSDFANRRSQVFQKIIYQNCLGDRISPILGVWVATGGRATLQKGGVRSPPLFGVVSRPPGAAQTPEMEYFRLAKE